jgi:hypothetical protein
MAITWLKQPLSIKEKKRKEKKNILRILPFQAMLKTLPLLTLDFRLPEYGGYASVAFFKLTL